MQPEENDMDAPLYIQRDELLKQLAKIELELAKVRQKEHAEDFDGEILDLECILETRCENLSEELIDYAMGRDAI